MPTRSRASSGSAAEDKELLAIFESTYGKVERRAFEPKRAPARTALDETRYNIKKSEDRSRVSARGRLLTSSSRGTRSKSSPRRTSPPPRGACGHPRQLPRLAQMRDHSGLRRLQGQGQSRLAGKEKRHLHRLHQGGADRRQLHRARDLRPRQKPPRPRRHVGQHGAGHHPRSRRAAHLRPRVRGRRSPRPRGRSATSSSAGTCGTSICAACATATIIDKKEEKGS